MKRIGLVVYPEFQILDMVALSVFEMANSVAEKSVYSMELLSEHGGTIRSSCGAGVATVAFGSTKFDTLMVAGGFEFQPPTDAMLAFLRKGHKASRRVASICTGAFVLGEAGLLDGRFVTTHWHHALDLQQRYPKAKVRADRIFVQDDRVWTSAGMTACIDLCLALIEDDLGADIARTVARFMVVYSRRTGGQSQFSTFMELEPRSERIQKALSYAKDNLHRDLSVDQLAEAAHLSPRQFSRAFLAETGQSPARAVEKLRVETARALIEDGHTIERVATRAGFADPERMRRAFHRAFGQPPQALRRAARQQTPAMAALAG